MKKIHVVPQKRMKRFLEIQFIFAAAYLTACNSPQVLKSDSDDTWKASLAQYRSIEPILQILNQKYVDTFCYIPNRDTSIDEIIGRLDPYSYRLTKEQNIRFDADMNSDGSIVEFGFQDGIKNDTPFITKVNPYSICRKNGLCIGDKILALDEVSLIHRTQEFIYQLFEASNGQHYTLTVLRPGEKIIRLLSVRKSAIPGAAKFCLFMVDSTTGYLWFSDFDFGLTTQVEQALLLLRTCNPHLSNLIIDIRWNDGGSVKEAVGLLSLFYRTTDPVVQLRSEVHPQNNEIYHTSRTPSFSDLDLIVLTNEHTFSAAEIFAGTLQDWDRALLIGQQTGGKGLVMQKQLLADSSVILLCTSRYFLPSGRCVQVPYEDGVQNEPNEESEKTIFNLFHREDRKFQCNDHTFFTKNGRPIYDQMGVVPDILVPDFSNAYAIRGTTYYERFELEFELVEQYQKLLLSYTTFEEFKNNFPIKEVRKYIAKRLKETNHLTFSQERLNALVQRIIYYIQYDYYGLGTQTRETLKDDNIFAEARTILSVDKKIAEQELAANRSKEIRDKKSQPRKLKRLALK